MGKLLTFLGVFSLLLIGAVAARAVTIDLVPVGNAGNDPDPETGYGKVDYPYWIGKYEITNAQWREFLTAKAKYGDPYGLYNPEMGGDLVGGISRSGLGTIEDPYIYSAKGGDTNWDNRPVNWVSFWDAARFCNWLNNGQGDGDTESGAYSNIGNQSTFTRLPGAKYFIPTENEWYKSAYYDLNKPGGPDYWDYPTGTDALPSNDLVNPDPGNNANFYQSGYTIWSPYYTTPVGEFENSASHYGTFDQGGNVSEMNETVDLIGSPPGRVRRGGAFDNDSFGLKAKSRLGDLPTTEWYNHGFRIAGIPEPSVTILLIGFAVISLTCWWKWRE